MINIEQTQLETNSVTTDKDVRNRFDFKAFVGVWEVIDEENGISASSLIWTVPVDQVQLDTLTSFPALISLLFATNLSTLSYRTFLFVSVYVLCKHEQRIYLFQASASTTDCEAPVQEERVDPSITWWRKGLVGNTMIGENGRSSDMICMR